MASVAAEDGAVTAPGTSTVLAVAQDEVLPAARPVARRNKRGPWRPSSDRVFSRLDVLRYDALEASRKDRTRVFWMAHTWPNIGWCWTGYYCGEQAARITRKGRRYVPSVLGEVVPGEAPKNLNAAMNMAARKIEALCEVQDRLAEEAELTDARRAEESRKALEASREKIAQFNARSSSSGRMSKNT